MNIYNSNIIYLCDQKGISITEFENIIYIPKVRIIDPQPEELLRIADYFDMSLDILLKKDLRSAARGSEHQIKLILLDVDGTMTDGGMYFTENGDRIKKYNSKDGMAIKNSIAEGIQFGIISHSHLSQMVIDRAELLGIQHVYVGSEIKIDILNKWCSEHNILLEETAFVGDDINDIEVMKAVGFSACPHDAIKSVKEIANVILSKNGGKGCVREFIDEWVNR